MPASQRLVPSYCMHQRAARSIHDRVFFSPGNSRGKVRHLQQNVSTKLVSMQPPTALPLLLPLIGSHVGALLSHSSHPPTKTSIITGSRYIVGSSFVVRDHFIVGSRIVSDFHRVPAFSRRWYRKKKSGNTTLRERSQRA